jgi:hypothetical protein
MRPNGSEIGLFDSNGLPNTKSADLWAFARPLVLTRELFYSPGQMNCDMLLTHDLVGSGYKVYNPCLDIALQHHEPEKDDAFYREKNSEDKTRDMLARHTVQNKVSPWNYFGNSWVRTDWLRAGYRPACVSTNARKILVGVPNGTEARLAETLHMLRDLTARHGLEAIVACDGDLGAIVMEHVGLLKETPAISLQTPRDGVAALQRTLMAGDQSGFDSLAFIGDADLVTDALLTQCAGVFLMLDAAPPRPAPLEFGCTLVTSVFRAEAFMRGFINNSAALTGYGIQIEHVFLVSRLSELEIELLYAHMTRHRAVSVLWFREDPGLYECWNIGIRVARTPYVSNANVDDLRDPAHVATLVADLEVHPDADVAATALNPFYDFPEDGTLPENREGWYSDRPGYFGHFDLGHLSGHEPPGLTPHNMPHCMPVWRRALHDRFGWFDEGRYGTYADWVFWLKITQAGCCGWLNPERLSFYFVNPTSHNRRGNDLDRLHALVEAEFIGPFLARHAGQPVFQDLPLPEVPRKLALTARALQFGNHRNSFNALVDALDPLDPGDGSGVRFLPFLERYFVWGDSPGEAGSGAPRPITEPWIGILHVPFEAPHWFERGVSPETFMNTPLFQASRASCRGIITLAEDLEADLKVFAPDLPTLSVKHPTSYDAALFDPAAYRAAPKVVQVGDWLRKLQAIHRLRAPGHQRIMLLKQWTTAFLDREIAVFGDARDPMVEMVEFVPNERYDALLSSSVVLCLLYGTAANNVVIECIARATPILINPLPAVVEYLGRGYPLYAETEAQADAHLAAPGRVGEAHAYLLQRRAELDLSYKGFCRDIAVSGLYEKLETQERPKNMTLSITSTGGRVLILANCTHQSIALALRASGLFDTVQSAELYSMAPADRDLLAEQIDSFDAVVTLEHAEWAGPLATKALRDRCGAKLLSLPTPFFSGLTPDMVYLKYEDDIARSAAGLGDYHSALLLADVQAGLDIEETVRRYVTGEVFERLDVAAVWQDSLRELKMREADCDIKLSDYIDAGVADGTIAEQFLSFNHPTEGMINHIACDTITKLTGRKVDRALITRDQHNLYSDAYWPMHPVVAETLGIPRPRTNLFKQPERLGNAFLSIEDFSRRSVEFFFKMGHPKNFQSLRPIMLEAT